MGTTLVLSKKLFVPLASPGRNTLPRMETLFVLCYLAFSTIAAFLHGLAIFLVLILMAYQSFRIVTCPEISESKTFWQEINKINKKESP